MLILLATAVGSMGLWILLVSGTKPEEMIVGAISTVLTVAFTAYGVRRSAVRVRLGWIDVAQVAYVPIYLVFGIWEILSVLFLDLLQIKSAESLYRAVRFETATGPESAGRQLLAIVYTTATPNFIILGIDRKSHWMLFYQLRRSGIPAMTRHLGAKA